MTDNSAFKDTITIQPASNGGFIVHRSARINEFAAALAFTNRADLLTWITGELAPAPTVRNAVINVVGASGPEVVLPPGHPGKDWIMTLESIRGDQPTTEFVDVKTRNGFIMLHRDPSSIDWSEVTMWRKSK